MFDQYRAKQPESKLESILSDNILPDISRASREQAALVDELTPQDIDDVKMAGEAWRAAWAPEFQEAAATGVQVGLADLIVIQLCAAIDDRAVGRGDLRVLSAVVRSIDPATGVAVINRAWLANDVGQQRDSLRNTISRMRIRGSIITDGEQYFAIGLRGDKPQLLVAKIAPSSTVIKGDDARALPSSPMITGRRDVATGDYAFPRPSSPLVTLPYTEASSVRTRGEGGRLHTTVRAGSGMLRPVEVREDGSLVLHHPSGNTRCLLPEQIESIARAHPTLSREDLLIHLRALLCDFAQKEWRYVPQARWTQQLQKAVGKLAGTPLPRAAEIQATTNTGTLTTRGYEPTTPNGCSTLPEIALWYPDNPPDGYAWNDGIFVNGIEAVHPEIGSIKFDRVAQLVNESLPKNDRRFGASDVRTMVINELQADARNRQLGAHGALLNPRYAAEDIAKVIAGFCKASAPDAIRGRGGTQGQRNPHIEHIINFKSGTVAIKSGDVLAIMDKIGATHQQVRAAIIKVDADLTGKIAQSLQAVLTRIEESVRRSISGGIGTRDWENPMIELYESAGELEA
jgi:hypothetical protein